MANAVDLTFLARTKPARLAQLAIALSASAGAASPAFAGPVTYEGTIGRFEIVVEFTAEPDDRGTEVHGRYFYRNQGIDIPLHFTRRGDGLLRLVEEEACDRDACPDGTPAPVGGEWALASTSDSSELTGNWLGAKSYRIDLRRLADRPAGPQEEPTPRGLLASSDALAFSEAAIDARTNPYDYAKLNVALETADVLEINGGRVAQMRDPRVQFGYPRIASLPGGGPADRANGLLNQRQWRQSLHAFNCAALRYIGFQEVPGHRWAGVGTFGGFDETSMSVTHLTDRVMSWKEGGSIMCGGASPSNFISPYIMDVERGELVGMDGIFAGWSEGRTPAALADFVNARRLKPQREEDLAHEEECGIRDLIETNLSIVLRPDGQGGTEVTFGLYNLPTVIAACSDDLLTVPVSEIVDYLTPAAVELLR